MTHAIHITGIGWIQSHAYGTALRNETVQVSPDISLEQLWKRTPLFGRSVKNFPRFDVTSKFTCFAVSLAIHDSGGTLDGGPHENIGILGSGPRACMDANMAYFSDYTECGRTLGRGNLFIYTLPSSPIAEAAIHFACQGPNFYVADTGKTARQLLVTGKRLLTDHAAHALFLVTADSSGALALLAGRSPDAEHACPYDTAMEIAGQHDKIVDLITGFREYSSDR